jgi:uncharacterized RDD family membrane protein YckC
MSTIKRLVVAAILSVTAWTSVALAGAPDLQSDRRQLVREREVVALSDGEAARDVAETVRVAVERSVRASVAQRIRVNVDGQPPFDVDRQPFFDSHGRDVVRMWQDFVLRAGQSAHDVVVIFGSATIAGNVDGDLVVVLGSAKLDSTAEISGSVVVIGGSATVAEGAIVRRDLMLFGGSADMPVSFYPGEQHIVIGNAWVGDRLRAVMPWLTHGLLWGRLIVPGLGWMWGLVGMLLIVTLAIDLFLHGAVGQCADRLSERPAGTFVTGLLVLFLTGPVSVVLVATLIGVAIVPFLFCALIVAWIVGKVAVTRWIGRSVTGQGSVETRLEAMRSILIGFAAVCLLYMVPIVGILTWGLLGVFGLGASSLTIIGTLRRERPAAPTTTAPGQTPPPPAATSFEPARMSTPEAEATLEPPPAYAPPPPVAGVGLALMPRATFLDRLAAAVLDVVLVMIVISLISDRHVGGMRFLALFAYFVAFWTWKGTTLGGIACNLRVTRVNGGPLGFADSLVRGLASIFSFAALGVGFLWILRDPQQQAWHDKIAGTCVVKVPRDYPL